MKRFLAMAVVLLHLVSFSTPAAYAGDGWIVTDANGNQYSSANGTTTDINVPGGGQYTVLNGDINTGNTVNVTVAGGEKAVFNIGDNHASAWDGLLNVTGLAAFVNSLGFNIGQNFAATVDGAAVVTSLQAAISASGFELARSLGVDPAAIVNKGTFNATPGSVVGLVGGAVDNSGNINVNGGAALIVAGDEVGINLGGDISVNVGKGVDAPVFVNGVKVADQISNSGNVNVDGGVAILSAKATSGIFDNVVNHTGLIQANTIDQVNGRIIIRGEGGLTSLNGDARALGNDLGEKGGEFSVISDQVALWDSADVNVSGYAGGGTALIGGDYQGLGTEGNAQQVYVAPTASIKADAIDEGNGGKVVVYADKSAQVYGNVSAKGGLISGDGGLIETSGKEYLDVEGVKVDASASNGNSGSWLLDPRNITITAATTVNNSGAAAFTPTGDNSQIAVGLINTQLNGGTNVTIDTGVPGSQGGTITQNAGADISKTAGGNATLTFISAGSMTFNGLIGATAALLNVVMNAGNSVNLNNNINTNGGSLSVTTTGGSADINMNNATSVIATSGGAVSFNAGDDVAMGNNAASITTAGGQVDITANDHIDTKAINSGAGKINLTASTGSMSIGTSLTTTGGDITANAADGISLASAVQVSTSGGNFTANANTDADSSGDFSQGAGGSLVSTGSGNIAVNAKGIGVTGSFATTSGNIGFTATNGNISITNTLTTGTGDINLNATGDISLKGQNADVTTGGGDFNAHADTDNSGDGDFIQDSGSGTVDTNGGMITVEANKVSISGTLATGDPANGGDISLTGHAAGTNVDIKSSAELNTQGGVGGGLFAGGGVSIAGALTFGQGNIILNSSGGGPDLIITVPIIQATSIFLTATRDIIVKALIQTTNPGDGNITLRADSDNDGVGGVWVQGTGKIDATQNVDIIGSDLFAIPVTKESIQVDADGVNDQIVAQGDITLETAGFAPASSNMNINGIVNTTGVGKTITVNSVGNINSSNDGAAEFKGDNLSLNSVEGIDVEGAVDNVSFNNSTSGNIGIENFGALTVTGAVNGGAGSTSITTHSPLTIASNMVQSGDINLTAGETGAAGDDLTVNGGVTVKSTAGNVNLKAGDNVNLQAASTVASDTSDVNITAGQGDIDGQGDINLAGAVTAADDVNLLALQGGINQTTGAVTANDLAFTSGDGNAVLNNSSNKFATVNGQSIFGNINLADSNGNVDIQNLQTTGGTITYNHTGTGDVTVSGTVDSGNAGFTNGGDIVMNASNQFTLANTGAITSKAGVGGVLSIIGSVTINGTITVGNGDITINGGSGPDLIITVPIISATSIYLSAIRDIIVDALVKTTNAADGNITLRADSDNDGDGGVWVRAGEVDAAQNIDIMGSNLFAIPVTLESIQVDFDGSNPQVHTENGGTIDLHTTGFAPAGSDMNLYGITQTSGLLRVDSVGNVNTNNDGNAELIANELKITAVEGIDSEINGGTAAFLNTTSGDVNLEDMAGGLTIGTVDGLVGGTNNGGNVTVETHSPLTIASNVSGAAVSLSAGESALAGDDLKVNSGVTVTATTGNVDLEAGDDVNFEAGSLVKSTTGAVNVTSGVGDLDGSGDVNFNGGQVNAATDAKIDSIGAINGTADGVADVVGDSINLTAQNGGINNLDVTAGSILNADTTADDGNIVINSIGNLPVGLVNAGTTGDVTLNSTGTIVEAVTDDGAPVADVIGGNLQFNTTGSDIGASSSYFDIYPNTSFGATTNGGDAYINCMSPICAVNQINLGTGTWYFSAVGDVVDFNDLVFGEAPLSTGIWNVTAGGAVLNIGGNFGSQTNAIELRLSDFNGVFDSDGRLESVTGGGLFVTNKNNTPGLGLTLGGITGAPSAITAGGDVIIASGSPLTFAANVNVGGNLLAFAQGNTTSDNITVLDNVDVAANGNINLYAGNNVVLNAGSVVRTAGNSTIRIDAGEDFTNGVLDQDGNTGVNGGDIIMAPTSAIRTQDSVGNGLNGPSIKLTAADDILLSEVNANSNGDSSIGDVETNSIAGSTLDNNDTDPVNPALNITADDLVMHSGEEIGLPLNPVETKARTITADAVNSIYLSEVDDAIINLQAFNGSIGMLAGGNLFLGTANAYSGEVLLNAGRSIVALNDALHIIARGNITLLAGALIGSVTNPINFNMDNPGTLNLLAGGSDSGTGFSANVKGNISPSSVNVIGAEGLVAYNGIVIGGAEGILNDFSVGTTYKNVSTLPLNQPQTGRFDARYAADMPGFINANTFATLPNGANAIDTKGVDAISIFGVPTPPAVVTVPETAAPATRKEEKQKKQAPAAKQQPAAKTKEEKQGPPAIVPIPKEATPTAPPDVEKNR